MTPLDAILVTGESRQPGLLSTEVATGALVLSVLTVDGVAYRPGDLPPGASLVVDDLESAVLAAQAGFVVEPPAGESPTSAKRRLYSFEGKLWGHCFCWAPSLRSTGPSSVRLSWIRARWCG
jgi:hypothetical protein